MFAGGRGWEGVWLKSMEGGLGFVGEGGEEGEGWVGGWKGFWEGESLKTGVKVGIREGGGGHSIPIP